MDLEISKLRTATKSDSNETISVSQADGVSVRHAYIVE